MVLGELPAPCTGVVCYLFLNVYTSVYLLLMSRFEIVPSINAGSIAPMRIEMTC